jgi:hypothetical protein
MNEAVTVPLPAELREHVREQAKREYTSEAAVVRRPQPQRLLIESKLRTINQITSRRGDFGS